MPRIQLPLASITFGGDVRLACLQVLSVDKLFDHTSVPEYTLILNDRAGAEQTAELLLCFLRDNVSEALQRKVVIRDFNEILPSSTPSGYYDQQAIKLGLGDYYADRLGSSAWLMLDAKNHFVAPCGVGAFLTDGRPISPRGRITPYWHRYVEQSFDAMDAGPMPEFMLPSITPYFMYVDIAQAVSRHLEAKYGSDLLAALEASKGTEFLLYFAQLAKSGQLDRYADRALPVRTLFTSWPQDADLVARMLDDLGPGKVPLFGLHRNRIPQLTSDQRDKIRAVWATALGMDRDQSDWYLAQG